MIDKKEKYERYGWTCSETNLATLPDSAPQAAKDLTKWLTLEGRRSSLQEYLNCVADDGKIHGKFWHIGAWTGRMSHSQPNQANIASVFSDEPKNAVEEIKYKYDGEIRALFHSTGLLIGTDADGIQLRILAHLTDDADLIEAISNGSKEDGTDIHTLNMKALGKVCRSRDTAKTFIYSWLLGAGTAKTAQVLSCSEKEAKAAVASFVDRYPGLKKLKTQVIPRDAARGYFIGLDGRRVPCTSEHLMLAGYLQNGEAVIMKKSCLLWNEWFQLKGYKYRLVDFVHDEWQTESFEDEETTKEMAQLQVKAIQQVGQELNLNCPLDGNSNIGRNWAMTH